MKKFLLKLVLFAMCFWAFDKLFLLLRNNAPNLEVDKKLERVLEGKFNHDVLIMGSSVSAIGIYAKQLGDSLKCKAYNLSSPGSDIEYQEFVLRKFIENKNKKPKLLVLAVGVPSELFYDKIVTFRYDRLYPLMKYPQVRDEMVARGEKNKFLTQLFVLHQLNKSNLDIRKREFTINDTILPCGSMPSSLTTTNFPSEYYDGNKPYNISKELESKRIKFLKFVALCKQENIKLLLVFMPRYHSRNFNFEHRIEELAGSYPTYYGYQQSTAEYKDKSFFKDAAHLNFKGARIYTNELAQFIKTNYTVH